MTKKADKPEQSSEQTDLVRAFVEALEAVKPPQKKTTANRKRNTPWSPKDGESRVPLKRKMYQHGLLIGERLSNEEATLLNKIRPGVYCDGLVTVKRRKDKGIDIDYPIRTASQKLKLPNQYGITSFTKLLQYIVTEAAAPRKPEFDADGDAI